MCGETPKYIVEVNGKEVDVDASQTTYTLSETYGGKDITWSVTAVVGDKKGPVSECNTTRVCLYEKLNSVTLSDIEDVSKTGGWEFSWTNPNPADGVCIDAANYVYTFSLTDDRTGTVVCSEVTHNTSVECNVGTSGLYRLSVAVSYGGMAPVEAAKNVSLCVPEVVDPPTVTTPANEAVFLEGELVTIKWTGLTQKETQCNAPVSHYLRYWAEDEEANATTLRLEDADMDVKLSELANNAEYHWELEEVCEYWDRNLTRAGTFRTCSPSTPPVPVLDEYAEGTYFGERFTLSWAAVNFGEVCEPRNKTGYHVYFFQSEGNYTDVPYTYVEEPSYTVTGATDDDYKYVVRAVNNGVLGEVSEAVDVKVCIPTVPNPPVLLSPMKGAFIKIRGGVDFDIVKENINWKACGK